MNTIYLIWLVVLALTICCEACIEQIDESQFTPLRSIHFPYQVIVESGKMEHDDNSPQDGTNIQTIPTAIKKRKSPFHKIFIMKKGSSRSIKIKIKDCTNAQVEFIREAVEEFASHLYNIEHKGVLANHCGSVFKSVFQDLNTFDKVRIVFQNVLKGRQVGFFWPHISNSIRFHCVPSLTYTPVTKNHYQLNPTFFDRSSHQIISPGLQILAWHVTLQLNDYFNHESAIEVNNERLGEDSPSGKILNPYSYVLYAAGLASMESLNPYALSISQRLYHDWLKFNSC